MQTALTALTAGAQRALERAGVVARRASAVEVEPVHLLWALVLDESRAAELLAARGFTVRQLLTLSELAVSIEDLVQDPVQVAAAEPAAVPPPVSAALQSVLIEARQQVGLLGRHVEVGTEHLLWGLATVASPVREVLQQHGLQPECLRPEIAAQSGASIEPLRAEVRLTLPGTQQSDHTDVYRLIDAAANRAREGLRVLEDYVRFALDDAHLTARLKTWRHTFAHSLSIVDARSALAARDTLQDVGTGIHTPQENARATLRDVVTANFKRVQEAVRTLEECGKILAPALGRELARLRYDLYVLEKAVLQTGASAEQFAGREVYLLVTESLCPRGSGPVIRGALAAGVGVVQIREKTMADRLLLEHARRVREWTRAAGALLIMNDRPDLAVLADADGVHVGQDELTVRDARRIVGPQRLVGVSTHSLDQARQAVLDGADYIGMGPVFPSQTKAFAEFAGLEFVRQVSAEIRLPAYAIGGIGRETIGQVTAAGAQRVAVSQAICGAENPEEAARELIAAVREHGMAEREKQKEN